jgi:FkbM family methyltransferase
VGSAAYLPYPWNKEKYNNYIDYFIGFDIIDRELDYIKKNFLNSKIYKNIIFDKEEECEFYICKRDRVSSLFKPNIPILIPYLKYLNKIRKPKKYQIDKYFIEKVKKVKCIRLETILNTLNVNFDFVKTDTEGADFQVIKSLGKYLFRDIIGIHAELYHKEMYNDIILFEEVNKYLTKNGFYLAKKIGGIKNYWHNFLYIREDKSKMEKLKLIKKVYKIK